MCQRRQKSWSDTGGVGGVEVLGEAEPEQQGDADRDVGVAAEVGIDLDRVPVDRRRGSRRSSACAGRRRPGRRSTTRCTRDDDLLEQPGRDQPEPRARSRCRRGSRSCRICGRSSSPRTIGPGDEVREERQVDGEVDGSRRWELAPVDVDHVADRHEGEERDRRPAAGPALSGKRHCRRTEVRSGCRG